MSNYQPLAIEFTNGAGAWLMDTQGQRYLDALSGIAVCGLGHAHPAVQEAIADQAANLIHTSNLYRIPLQEKLAEKLVAYSGMDKVFFGNSGAEANEAAIKLARLYASNKDISDPVIVVMDNSFHGRTMATLSATGNAKVQKGFDPLVAGFKHIPYNDVAALNELSNEDINIVAVMVEPILGEGGVVIPDAGYLKAIRSFCDQHDCLMMVDEIQTGMCRTGKWFAFQHEDVMPDVLTLAKAWEMVCLSAPVWRKGWPQIYFNPVVTDQPSAAIRCHPGPPWQSLTYWKNNSLNNVQKSLVVGYWMALSSPWLILKGLKIFAGRD